MESMMSNAVYEITDYKICAPNELYYSDHIESPLFTGWKQVKQQGSHNILELQAKNQALILHFKTLTKSMKPITVNAEEIMHNKHSHYTESGLLKKLEELCRLLKQIQHLQLW